MAHETLLYTKEEGGIALITLNRPDRLNSLSQRLITELGDLLDEIEKDDEVRVFIITGAPRPDGRPCFSAGADLKELAESAASGGVQLPSALETVEGFVATRRVEAAEKIRKPMTMSKLSIAAIDGVCTAGGLELAMSCDMRVCSETARVSDMHIKNTLNIGGAYCTSLLARIVGPAKALELCVTCEEIDGHEAYRIGFANRVFPPDKLIEGTMALSKLMASRRPEAVRAAKAVCFAAVDMPREQALSFDQLALSSVPMDFAGIQAFAKR